MEICVYGASSNEIAEKYIRAGEELGRCLARRGYGMIYGGGSAGMMGAVARGMRTVEGARIIGISPSFFHVDGILDENCTEMIYTETMGERKELMEERADGFLITPGGVGTMDEFFEILTLRQIGQTGKPIAILNTDGYYDVLDRMLEQMAEEHFMNEKSRSLCSFFREPEALVEWMAQEKESVADIRQMKSIGVGPSSGGRK